MSPAAGDAGVSRLWAFHRRTEHAPGAPARGGPFDPAIEPAKTKTYPGLETIPLPERWPEPDTGASQVLSGTAPTDPVRLDRDGLARLLFLSVGVTRTMHVAGGPRHFRAAPSAGALYPVEAYAVCGELPGLAAGVYHYEPEQHGLHRLREGDHRALLARAAVDEQIAARPVTLVLTGILWRTAWKYGPRGYRHLYWDAGTVIANTLAAAASADWPARVLGGFADDRVGRLLDLGDHLPFQEWPLALTPIGAPGGEEAPDRDEPGLRRLEVAPLSASRTTAAAVDRIHATTVLSEPTEVEVWREALRALQLPAAAPRPLSPPPTGQLNVDELILRRGSTRAFDHRPVPEPEATWMTDVGMGPVAGDMAGEGASPLTAQLAVHAVEGVAAGGYRWRPSGWRRTVEVQSRELTAHLCLDQELGGDAALTVFLCARLGPLLEAAGPRGYRVAQLAAGIAAGRLQLAAFTVGIGGTGLTFYDGQVRRHFDADAEPMLVVALGHPGYEARRGRRPGEARGR